MYESLGRFVVKHRLLVLAGLLVVTIGSAALLPQIGFDFTPQQLFEQQDEVNDFAKSIRTDFNDETNTLIVVWRTGEEHGVYAPQVLEDIKVVTDELATLDYAVRTASIANIHLPRNEWQPKPPYVPKDSESRSRPTLKPQDDDPLGHKFAKRMGKAGGNGLSAHLRVRGRQTGNLGMEPVLNLGELVPELPVTPEAAALVRQHVEGEPLLDRVIVSPDGARTAILIEMDERSRDINTLIGMVHKLEDRLAGLSESLESKPELTLSGLPQVRVHIIESLQTEQIRFLPMTGAIMVLLLFWMFRRASGVILPAVSIVLALIWSGAMLVIVNQPINIINSVMPTLLMVIGLSDGIHLLSRASEEMHIQESREEVVVQTIRRMGLACLLTSVTTAIGFASLITARTDILRDFGLHTAIGVMLAYMSTLLFIPVMLTWMTPPERSGLTKEGGKPGYIERIMAVCADWVLAKPVPFIVAGALLAGGGAYASWTYGNIDTELLEVFPPGHPHSQLVQEVENEFGGVLPMTVSVEAQEEGYFEEPENLAKLAAFQQSMIDVDAAWSEEHGGDRMVLKTNSVHDMLQVFRTAYVNDPSVRDTDFDSKAQVTTVLRLYRNDAASDIDRMLSRDNRHALISVRLRDMGIQRGRVNIEAIAERADELFGEGASQGIVEAEPPSEVRPVQVRLAGDVYLASVGLANFINDLLYSLGLASVIIFIAMMVLFRSFRIGLISIVPNAFPLIMTSGWMALRGINLNTSTVVIFSISLGLAVDDTIHFLTRYQEEREDCHSIELAIRRTFMGAGRAIVITSIVLACGLGVLLTTDFMPTRYFAELIGTTVVGAIIGDLFILPGLLLLFDKKESASDAEDGSESEDDVGAGSQPKHAVT